MADSPTVLVVGALDTKGDDFSFLRDVIVENGAKTLVLDTGVLGAASFTPDIDRTAVMAAAGSDPSRLTSGDHKDEAMAAMMNGAAVLTRKLFDEGRIDGVISMGGSGGTAVAAASMRALPVGVPKLMVSTVASGDVSPYVDVSDVTMMPSIVDVAGVNRISRSIYANAGAAIAGMVRGRKSAETTEAVRPVIAASMFGNTTDCVNAAKALLEAAEYEVLVFHATGVGGRTMEGLATSGMVDGFLDLTTTELADEVCGGVFSAGPDRGRAAPAAGLPTVVAPGCVDMANFGGPDTVPAKYADRTLYRWNDNVTLLRTNVEENQTIGRMLAAAVSKAKGPISVLLPLGGVSMLDSEGHEFWDPEADRACFDTLRTGLRSDIRVIEVDANINHPDFARAAADELLHLMKEK